MSYSVSIPQLPEVADAVARARISDCRAPHIDAGSPVQIQDVISAQREIESRKRSYFDREGATEIEVAQARIRKTAILLEHAAIDYGGDAGAPLYFIRGMKALKDEFKDEIKALKAEIKAEIKAEFDNVKKVITSRYLQSYLV
jgi:hypothetical protein